MIDPMAQRIEQYRREMFQAQVPRFRIGTVSANGTDGVAPVDVALPGSDMGLGYVGMAPSAENMQGVPGTWPALVLSGGASLSFVMSVSPWQVG